MTKDILILANSRKPGGRCIAGKTSDGNWIRLVKPGGRSIPTYEAKNLNLLGLYNVDGLVMEEDLNNTYHTENHTYESYYLKSNVNSFEDLQNYLDNPDYIYRSIGRKLIKSEAERCGYSLLFVKVNNLVIEKKDVGYAEKPRCSFRYRNNDYYDFSLTEPSYEKYFEKSELGCKIEYDVAYLTISLGEIYKDGYAYKLVTAIMN